MYHRMYGNSGGSWLLMALTVLVGLLVLGGIVYAAVRRAQDPTQTARELVLTRSGRRTGANSGRSRWPRRARCRQGCRRGT